MAGTYVYIPNYPYTTDIYLPFHFVNKTDGSLGIRDDGSSYDYRRCKFIWEFKPSIASKWATFLQDRNRYLGFNMKVESDTDFYPYGCDCQLAQTYPTKLVNLKNAGQISSPYKYHRYEVEVQLTDTPTLDVPSSNPSCVEPGTLTIGTIDKVRFPDDMFKPDVQYSFRNVSTRNGDIYAIQPGIENDYEETVLTIRASRAKAAMLINHILTTIRANTFSLVVGANSYPFGLEQGDNKTFTCKLNQQVISIKHIRYNEFQFDLKMRRV